jgi:DNA-binding LacI/PurR family transcriptional regulator
MQKSVPKDRLSSLPNGRVTLKFLAQHLELSPTTISVVISNSPLAGTIAAATKKRIWAAVRQFDYRPNLFARYLQARRTYSIAVMVPDIGDEFSSSLISGIESCLAEKGYFYFVISHRGAPHLIDKSPDTLLDRGAEGIVAINTPLERDLPVPVVAVSDIASRSGVSRIVIDNARAASLGLKHLAQLGHQKIAFLKGPLGNGDSANRWRSIRAAASQCGIEIDPSRVRELGKYPECNETTMANLGYQQTHDLLKHTRDFTALMAFNDGSAIGAIRACQDAGLRVPEDVSIVGFDDIEQAAFIVPRLTTLRQPLRQMGRMAAATLIQRIENPDTPASDVVIQPTLVIRESTAPARSRRTLPTQNIPAQSRAARRRG